MSAYSVYLLYRAPSFQPDSSSSSESSNLVTCRKMVAFSMNCWSDLACTENVESSLDSFRPAVSVSPSSSIQMDTTFSSLEPTMKQNEASLRDPASKMRSPRASHRSGKLGRLRKRAQRRHGFSPVREIGVVDDIPEILCDDRAEEPKIAWTAFLP